MKRLILAIFFLCLIPSVFAVDVSLDCQYQDKDMVMESQRVLVNDRGKVVPSPLEIGEIIIHQDGSPCWFSIPITNKLDYRVSAMFDYKLNVTDDLGSYIKDDSFGKVFGPYEKDPIGRSWSHVSHCSFIEGSVDTTYQDSLDLKIQTHQELVEKWTCRRCNGKQCLDDGVESEDPADCGGGLIQEGKCTAHCNDGFSPCNNRCLPAGTKGVGATYECKSECQTFRGEDGICIECSTDDHCTRGICNTELYRCVEYFAGTFSCDFAGKDHIPCNQTKSCVLPSSKKNGEGYDCVTECISGRGVNGVCRMNFVAIIFYSAGFLILLILIITVIIIGARLYHQRLIMDKVKIEARALEEQERKLDAIKEKHKETIKIEKKKHKETRDRRKRTEKELRLIQETEKQIEKQKEKLYKTILVSEAQRRRKYTNKQGYPVIRNENDYEVLINYKGGEGELFHRFWVDKQIFRPNRAWFEKEFGSEYLHDYVIHHIDSNHLNNDEQNLVIIPKKIHDKINHREIPKGNREAGISQLKKLNIKQPHITDL